MSWLAEAKAIASVRLAIIQIASGCVARPASHSVSASNPACVTKVQPSLRLRRLKGSVHRSINGDQRNLKLQGACASVKRPMILMSTFSNASHAGIVIATNPSGNPEESDNRLTAAVRQLRRASHIARHDGGRSVTELSRDPR